MTDERMCKAKLITGERHRMVAAPGSDYCFYHGGRGKLEKRMDARLPEALTELKILAEAHARLKTAIDALVALAEERQQRVDDFRKAIEEGRNGSLGNLAGLIRARYSQEQIRELVACLREDPEVDEALKAYGIPPRPARLRAEMDRQLHGIPGGHASRRSGGAHGAGSEPGSRSGDT